ncbi:MAG: anthranilate phosphoribosyltransferase [Bacteroidota bacterium]
MLKEAVGKLAEKIDLTQEEAHASMNEIMGGQARESLIAGFLVGLRLKGETPEEIAGCALSMRQNATMIKSERDDVIDTCGTGGDSSGTFNVSTTAAIIASAAGVPVAKHGNRAVSSVCGSADVLKSLGIKIEMEPDRAAMVLDEIGITFLFAPRFHGAMKYAAEIRKQLGIRTVFNILGPLTNPAGVKRQVIGVFSQRLTETLASVLQILNCEHALIVHGDGGFDEFSTMGVSTVSELRGGSIRNFSMHVSETGLRTSKRGEVAGGDPTVNAAMIRSILDGVKGAPSDLALFNAGAAVYVGGKADSVREGVNVAREALVSGKAKKKLIDWIEASNSR